MTRPRFKDDASLSRQEIGVAKGQRMAKLWASQPRKAVDVLGDKARLASSYTSPDKPLPEVSCTLTAMLAKDGWLEPR